MANFAKINSSNIVEEVIIIDNHRLLDNEGNESEAVGLNLLNKLFGDISPSYWKQTSYNTHGGIHYASYGPEVASADQSKALRKNYAGVGAVYDAARNAFYEVQPIASWTLNETTCLWDPPVAKPADDPDMEEVTTWDESLLTWTGKKRSDATAMKWDAGTSTWVAI
tara:strand:- start:1526 stop:2026 length:501 start_codon:yes stop_codon:yes gene_type:complete